MISRHSSGSSRAAISVEPTRSQNNTVRCRRSPPADAATGAVPAASAGGTTSPNAVPHSPQKLSSGWLGAPHLGQAATSGVPQLVQNLRPARLSRPHLEQRILPHSGCVGFVRSRLCCLLVHTLDTTAIYASDWSGI